MLVAVTGASGFVGGHVCDALVVAGHDVVEFDLHHPVCDLPWKGVDACVHLAAHCGGIGRNRDEPAEMLDVNARLALDVVQACAAAGVHLIALGSVCAYPKDTPIPFREKNLWNGYPEETNAPYGIAKRLLLEACRAYGGPYTYLLPANMYGPGDHFDIEHGHVIPAMIAKLSHGNGRLWGHGSATRDFLYVTDCAEAIVRAVETWPHPEPINVGTGVETSIEVLAMMVAGVTAFTGRIEWDESKPSGQPRRCLETTKAKEVLGWQATTALVDGLERTAKWYRSTNNLSEPKRREPPKKTCRKS